MKIMKNSNDDFLNDDLSIKDKLDYAHIENVPTSSPDGKGVVRVRIGLQIHILHGTIDDDLCASLSKIINDYLTLYFD